MPSSAKSGASPLPASSLGERLANTFVSPGDVFDEVIAAPLNIANWLVPTLLTAMLAVVMAWFMVGNEELQAALGRFVGDGLLSADQAAKRAHGKQILAVISLLIGVAAFAGTFWSAFVLWFVGRVFLRTRFSYFKAVEVVGLASVIMGLGVVFNGLIIAASGDPTARPAASFLVRTVECSDLVRAALALFDVFHLWALAVITVGLSRLCGASFKETAFWTFGYWLGLRLLFIVAG